MHPTQEELNELRRRADWFDHDGEYENDQANLLHGLKVAFYAEAFAVCLIIAGWFAYHSQTVVRF